MARKSLVIDTNLYISFLINKGNSAIQAILEDTNMEIIVSEKLKDAGADFLITGDKDLLVLQQFENTRILTLAALAEFSQ